MNPDTQKDIITMKIQNRQTDNQNTFSARPYFLLAAALFVIFGHTAVCLGGWDTTETMSLKLYADIRAGSGLLAPTIGTTVTLQIK